MLPVWCALVGLFLSGAAGLIDEVCWIRRSSLVFGSTTYAVSTVLMVYFLGLAAGSWTFGRLAQRARRPLRLCGALEVGLAALVLASLPAFTVIEGVYGRLYRALPADSPVLWLARAGLIASILFAPTFLMGGTLPLFSRQLVRDPQRIGSSIARLYALNTLGAAVGCLAAGFVLLSAVGMSGALAIAASLNLIAGGFMAFARTGELQPIVSQPAAAPVRRSVHGVVAALLFAVGFVALGTEVLWTRFLALLLDNTVYTYTITLALVLVGIVLGSGLVACLPDRTLPRARLFGGLQVANGLLVWGLLMLPASAWNRFGGPIAVASILLLPPALLAGAAFPLGVRMVIATPAWAGIGVGSMTAVNTLGGIVGALAVGFFLLPRFGLEASVRFCTAVSLAVGFAAWARLDPSGTRLPRLAVAAAAVLAWLAIPRLTGTRLPADFLAAGGTLVDYREGRESNVALVRRNPGTLALEIDRWWQGQDKKTHQVMAAHLPMMLHPEPRRVLVVGVGAGQTPMRITLYDVERLDCVDIEPAVFDLIRVHFPSAWMNDPRVRLLREDGRNYLTHTAERYDVISLEVGQVFRPGVASFYTLDFYRRARERLRPGGLLSQFVPLAFLSPAEVRGVIATFLDVFPQATLWYNTSELLLIGSPDTPLVLRPERLAQLTSNPAIAEDLRFSLWGGPDQWLVRPEVLLGGFLCGPRALAALSAGAPVYRDDQPILEYAAGRARDSDMRELQTLPLLRHHLESVESVAPGVSIDLVRAAANVREKNLNDMVAAAHLRRVEAAVQGEDHGSMVAELRLALAANPENLQANRLMGDALLSLGQVEESERFYRQALAIWDGDPRVHASLALAYLRQRRLDGAVEHYRAALAVGDDDAELRNSLGAALGLQGNLAGALEQFERALALRPDFEEARGNLAQSRAALDAQRTAGTRR